jgi:hypothetical protein
VEQIVVAAIGEDPFHDERARRHGCVDRRVVFGNEGPPVIARAPGFDQLAGALRIHPSAL